MEKKICHDGVVERVSAQTVWVRIRQTSACAACQAASFCQASESKEKTVEVQTAAAASYREGDRVAVWASPTVARCALLWAFGVPFVLLVAVLVGVLAATGSEGVAAVASLLALFPYYGVLWLLRRSLRRQLTFGIEKI